MTKRQARPPESKIFGRGRMAAECDRLRDQKRTLVFTNGTFDLLHAGHTTYLNQARELGDVLIVGLNSDESIRAIKGDKRPIIREPYRSRMLAALECVDYVVLFDEDEPRNLISELLPDVLVKAEDWAHYVSGRDVVEANGGRVVLAPLVPGLSSSGIIRRIREVFQDPEEESR